jgi:SAM-dependent methyltransferase
MGEGPQTWHYGLVAKWWAEFNDEGPEIAYFQRFIEADGQPALDVACGTGRLLVPYLRAGLDVDGCDISEDMIALCREKSASEELTPNLFVQAMHDLDLPRTYKTIIVCGGFGLGSSREQDFEALRRFYDHLEPGGTLVLDKEVPYADQKRWPFWLENERRSLPEEWPQPGERRRASDGAEYELRVRLIDLDPLDQCIRFEMRASMWQSGQLTAEEEHTLTERLYFRSELLLMMEQAGFVDVDVRGDYTDEEATGDHDFLVFIARKPS